jgi:hypothetical protein
LSDASALRDTVAATSSGSRSSARATSHISFQKLIFVAL